MNDVMGERSKCNWLAITTERFKALTPVVSVSLNPQDLKVQRISRGRPGSGNIASFTEDWQGRNVGAYSEVELVHSARKAAIARAEEYDYKLVEDLAYECIFHRMGVDA